MEDLDEADCSGFHDAVGRAFARNLLRLDPHQLVLEKRRFCQRLRTALDRIKGSGEVKLETVFQTLVRDTAGHYTRLGSALAQHVDWVDVLAALVDSAWPRLGTPAQVRRAADEAVSRWRATRSRTQLAEAEAVTRQPRKPSRQPLQTDSWLAPPSPIGRALSESQQFRPLQRDSLPLRGIEERECLFRASAQWSAPTADPGTSGSKCRPKRPRRTRTALKRAAQGEKVADRELQAMPAIEEEPQEVQKMMILNAENIGRCAAQNCPAFEGQSFVWEAVEKAMEHYEDQGFTAQGVCCQATMARFPPPPQLQHRLVQCPVVDKNKCNEGRTANQVFVVRLAQHYTCPFVDNSNFLEAAWRGDASWSWLQDVGLGMKTEYIFDVFGTFVPARNH